MKRFILFVIIIFINSYSFSQDNLESDLLKAKTKQEKIEILDKLIDNNIENNKQKALNFALDLEKLLKRSKNTALKQKNYKNLGSLYYWQSKFKKSLNYFDKELKLRENQSDQKELAKAYYNLGSTSLKVKNNKKALDYFEKSLEISKKINFKPLIVQNNKALAKTYGNTGRYRKAYESFKTYVKYTGNSYVDEIELFKNKYYTEKKQKEQKVKELNITSQKLEKTSIVLDSTKEKLEISEVKRQNLLLDSIEKAQKINILNLNSYIAKLEAADKDSELKRQRQITYIIIAGLILVILFSLFIFKLFLDKKKMNATLIKQKSKIEKQNKEITQSIFYASRIQKAVLPSNENLKNLFTDYFILYKPRNIVSGDYYFAQKINDYILFTAADCTGHGVPGAFMSMMGISMLNQIVHDNKVKTAAQVLNIMRENIKLSLNQSGKKNEQKDGMDMALCALNTKTNILQFAGAYNSLIIIRDNEMIEYKADRMPVGIYVKEKESFTNHEIKVQKNDIIYIFSDGYADQLNYETNQKFMKKRFKRFLLEISSKSLNEQKEILNNKFEEWKGDGEQVDDVVIFGVKI